MPSGASAVGFAIAANSLDQGRFGSACFGSKPHVSLHYDHQPTFSLIITVIITVTALPTTRLCRTAVFFVKPTLLSSLQRLSPRLCRVAVFLIQTNHHVSLNDIAR